MIRRGDGNKPPDTFRFDSTRFIGQLKKPTGLEFETVKFEVQVKTIFDFAWTKTTHALAYKSKKLSWQRLRCVIGSSEILDNKSAKSKKQKYFFLVTDEMKMLYPKLKIYGEMFKFENELEQL